jgi:hypothetical protein
MMIGHNLVSNLGVAGLEVFCRPKRIRNQTQSMTTSAFARIYWASSEERVAGIFTKN